MNLRVSVLSVFCWALCLSGCAQGDETAKKSDKTGSATAQKKDQKKAPSIKTDKGVDLAKKTITIGILNDQSGPAATIGKAFGAGKRILAAQVNSGKSKLLPDGWTIKLVEKDHAYNPSKSQQAFDAVKNDVLFVGLSFGTHTTLPLVPFLQKEQIVSYPASLSSLMASNRYTPPAGPSYKFEARRAMDWIVKDAGGADKVKIAIVFQQDDFGKDALAGLKASAKKHVCCVCHGACSQARPKRCDG